MNADERAKVRPLWIGMPVYNSKKTIAQALESLLSQSFGDFTLFISDNASNDGTSAIIQSYADRDQRIRYIRQEKNQGAAWNFSFVLNQADAEYFMWAAGDDYWGKHFIRDNIERLSERPEASLSVSRAAFIQKDGSCVPVEDTNALMGVRKSNIFSYVRNPSTNSRFYGIHRRRILLKAFRLGHGDFLASDWGVMVYSLCFGTHQQVDEMQLFRHVGGASAGLDRLLKPFRRDILGFFLPMARFSLVALRIGPGLRGSRLILTLALLNFKFALIRFMPVLRLLNSILRRISSCLKRGHHGKNR